MFEYKIFYAISQNWKSWEKYLNIHQMKLSSTLKYDEQKKSMQLGHRKRLHIKLEYNYESLFDYEIVELFLFLVFKRKDTKTLAKLLLQKFKTMQGILNATKEDLLSINGIGNSSYQAIQIVRAVVRSVLRSKIMNQTIINCFRDVINYCKINMQFLRTEELRIIFLDGSNKVIADEVIERGTIDTVAIHTKGVLKKCIKYEAQGIIVIHNHPSGVAMPSQQDVFCTQKLREACKVFDVCLIDHIIIAGNKYVSFKNLSIL
jgi:DNA repair protein RadC